MSIMVFKKSTKHSNASQIEAKCKFDCDCGQKEIYLTSHKLQEYTCKCGNKYRLNCYIEMEVKQDVDYEHSLDLCEKCTIPLYQCPDPENPKKLIWCSGDIEPLSPPELTPNGR